MTDVRVGIDVGGTKIAAGVVDADGRITAAARRATPPAAQVADCVAALVREVAAGRSVVGVGIGAAGFVDADRSTVLTGPNLAWDRTPLGAQVTDLLDVPVVVENDGNAAAWAEHRFGAGRGVADVLMVTAGTGIGGGIVVGGRLVRGSRGIAAEIGHVRYERDGLPCGCGQRGCLEQYASGSALERRAIGRVVGDGPQVTRRAIAGDAEAQAVLAEVGGILGEGVAQLVAVLDPELVVVGGGVSEAGELFVGPMRAALAQFITGGQDRRTVPQVRIAVLGNDAGLVGAADLSRRDDRGEEVGEHG